MDNYEKIKFHAVSQKKEAVENIPPLWLKTQRNYEVFLALEDGHLKNIIHLFIWKLM